MLAVGVHQDYWIVSVNDVSGGHSAILTALDSAEGDTTLGVIIGMKFFKKTQVFENYGRITEDKLKN